MPEEQDAAIGLLRLVYGEALIRVGSVGFLAKRDAGAAAPAFGAVGLAGLGKRLLRRILFELHVLASSAASTRSGVIGSARGRAPVALQMALAIAGAGPTSEGS